MSWLTNNFAPVFVAFAVSLMAWLYGGTRGELLTATVPWMFLFMLEVVFCFPQRRAGESTHSARERAWRDMRRDPLVWTAVGFLALLMVPFVNNALCPLCDAEAIAAGHSASPPIPFLPYSVDRIDHMNVVFWFAMSFSAMVAVKHSMNDAGKILTLKLIVWNGFALAVLGFVQTACGAPGPLWSDLLQRSGRVAGTFFSTFGYPNMAGDYFTTLFAISLALWRWSYDEVAAEIASDVDNAGRDRRGRFWRQHYFLIPAGLFFFAVLNTLSRASMLLVTALTVVLFAHAGVVFLSRMHKVKRVKRGVWGAVAVGVLVFVAFNFTPEDVRTEIDTLNTEAVLDRVTGKGQYHTRVATEIWKENMLFGCGGWGYLHYSPLKMAEGEKLQMVGGINVHNDYLQFLAEHGLAGLGAIVAIIVMLVWPIGKVWRRLVKIAQFSKSKNRPPSPVQIFAMPAGAFYILAAAAATLVHGFGDCPLRSAAVMTLFFVMLAAAQGFMPDLDNQSNKEK